MNRSAWLLFLLGSGLWAQSSPPQLTVSASTTFAASDQPGTSVWTTQETVSSGLTARWGNDFVLSGTVKGDFSGRELEADDVLGELALTWNANESTIVTVGKQRLSWGTARVFSAIDSLEPRIDPLDLKTKPRGVTGARAEVLPLDWLSFWLLALPAARLDDAVLAAKADVLWGETDLSAGALRSVAYPRNASKGGAPDRRDVPVFFADFARFFDRFGFYGEAQLRQGRNREWLLDPGLSGSGPTLADLGAARAWTLRATGGLQIEFPVWMNGTLRWLTEYSYNGDGFSDGEARLFARAWKKQDGAVFLPPAGLEVGEFRRHYVYTGLSGLPVTEKLSLGASVIAGLDGGLVRTSGSADWELNPGLYAGAAYERFDRWNRNGTSELLFLPLRNRVSLSLSAWY